MIGMEIKEVNMNDRSGYLRLKKNSSKKTGKIGGMGFGTCMAFGHYRRPREAFPELFSINLIVDHIQVNMLCNQWCPLLS
jgi:hypothetical protein